MAASPPPGDVVVGITGRQYHRTPAEMASGLLTPKLPDADYQLMSDTAMLSAVVYSGVKSLGHRPDYRQDTITGRPQRTCLVYENYEVLTPFRFVPVCLNRFAKSTDLVVRYNLATGLEVL